MMTKDYISQLVAVAADPRFPMLEWQAGNMLKNLHKTSDNSFPCSLWDCLPFHGASTSCPPPLQLLWVRTLPKILGLMLR